MISVIIPTYNTAALIERAINSVLQQWGQWSIEIWVVDDCSTDNTLDLVEKIADPRIHILRQEKNQGPAAARNRGLAASQGEYCAFLDGDDYWEPEFLQQTVPFLEQHPETVAVSVMQQHKIIGKAPAIVPLGTGIEQPQVLTDFLAFWSKYGHVCTGSALLRSAIAQKTGGQREELRICEDLEFWLLLATYGPWGFIPKVLFTSDGGAVTRSQGWLEKNLKRWHSAPSVAEWSQRIAPRVTSEQQNGFNQALGKIARNLCYCHIMSDKFNLARQEVQQYGSYFAPSKVNKLFKIASKHFIFWHLWCIFLKYREFSRSLK